MQGNEYQRLCRKFDNHRQGLKQYAAAIGLASEAGEVAGEYERSWRKGHHLHPEKVALELGDVLWNVARLADELGYPLENLLEANIAKLEARYAERGLNVKDVS